MDSAIDQLNALHDQLFGQKNNNNANKENIENGYNSDTDNEEEWPQIYIASDPKFDNINQNSDRVKQSKQFHGIKWNALVLTLGNPIQQFIDERIEKWKNAQPVDYLEKMEAKKVPTDALRAVSSNLQSTLGQFWKFVSTYEPGHSLSILDIASRTRIRAFQRFLRSRFPSFGTIHRKLNDLRTLLKWMFKKSRFTTHHTHIRKCIDHISDNLVSLTRSMQNQQTRQSDEKQLKQRGKLLNEKEFAKLNDSCLDMVNKLINLFTYRELAITDKQRKKFTSLRNYAFKFQTCLQILCLIRMGTQRRQVISAMAGFEIEKPKERNSDNNSSSDDNEDEEEESDPTEWMAKLFPTREKTVRKGCRAIPIPEEIFKLLEYFQKTIREHLKPKPEVESLWISFKNGTVQQGYQMSIAIKNQIAEFLPGKQITPLDLRRSMPTIIQKLKFAGNESNTEALLAKFAKLVNTSERMLQQHYIRYQDLNAQAELITTLNNNLTNTENTNRLLENTNQLMEINNQIDSLRPNRNGDMGAEVIIEQSNMEVDVEIIEPIPMPVFGLELLGITRNQHREDSRSDNSPIEDYSSALNEIQI